VYLFSDRLFLGQALRPSPSDVNLHPPSIRSTKLLLVLVVEPIENDDDEHA
jgi:hypothetical protein